MVTLFKFSCGYCQECTPTVTPVVRYGRQQVTNDDTPVYQVKCATGYTVTMSVIDGEQVRVIACDDCGDIVAEESTTTDDYTDHTLCEGCAQGMIEVYARGSIITHIDNCSRVYSGHLVLTDYVTECDNCGNPYCSDYHCHPTALSNDGHGCGYDGYCSSCHESIECTETDRSGILPYSTDVTSYCDPDTMGDNPDIVDGKPLFIGVELESFIDDDSLADCCVSHVRQFRCIPTTDSSLDDDNGVEFIFTHQTPENIVASIKGLLNKSDIDFLSVPSEYYGLHVHIDKISKSHALKVQNFVAAHVRVLSKVGGRGANTYARTKCCKKTDIEYTRYTSVNMTENTLEYRFPSSSEKAPTVINRVLTCYLVHVYCAQINQIQACKFNFARFVLWAHSDKIGKRILALSPSLSGLLSSFLFCYTGV